MYQSSGAWYAYFADDSIAGLILTTTAVSDSRSTEAGLKVQFIPALVTSNADELAAMVP